MLASLREVNVFNALPPKTLTETPQPGSKLSFSSFTQRFLARSPRLYASVLLRRPHPDPIKLACVRLVRRGDVVIDVGANFGRYTKVCADLAGTTGHVYAFEPVPITHGELVRNLSETRNVTLIQKGLADASSKRIMFMRKDDLGKSSLVKQMQSNESNGSNLTEQVVELATLDEFMQQANVSRLDFMKVDIEGAEPLFLKGAKQALVVHGPKILMEVNSAWLKGLGETPLTVETALRSLGYGYFYEPQVSGRSFTFQKTGFSSTMNKDVLCSRTAL